MGQGRQNGSVAGPLDIDTERLDATKRSSLDIVSVENFTPTGVKAFEFEFSRDRPPLGAGLDAGVDGVDDEMHPKARRMGMW